MAVECM